MLANTDNVKIGVNIEIDAYVNETATNLLERMGMDPSTAVEVFYRKIIAAQAFPFQPEPVPSSAELLLAAIKRKNIPHRVMETNAAGEIVVDKEKDPDLYDWAVNG